MNILVGFGLGCGFTFCFMAASYFKKECEVADLLEAIREEVEFLKEEKETDLSGISSLVDEIEEIL